MSETEEASYYEIALTSRQVLIAFVILLVCMLASFFAGLWAGRGGTPAVAAEAETVVAEQPPPPDDELEEFTFFSEGKAGKARSLQEIVDDPDPDTTLVEDLGGELPPPPGPPARTVPEQPPEEANPAIPRGTARPPPPPSPPPSGQEMFVQVFSSADQKQARKVLHQLLDSGYSAFLSPVEVGAQTMFRVRIGPFGERAKADDTAEKVRRRFQLDTWITSS